jgi:hypothetical protein
MTISTLDEIIPSSSPGRIAFAVPTAFVALVPGLVGAVVALILGLLTFGVQSTLEPRHLPLAVGAADPAAKAAVAPAVGRVTAHGGDLVEWRRVDSRAEAERLLDAKAIYGALLFSPGPGGLTATVLVSGALNPTATQVAQPILTQIAMSITSAARAQLSAGGTAPAAPQGGATSAVQAVIIHPTSAASRTLPLAASALLWLATLVTNVVRVVLAPRLRGGRPLGRVASVVTAVAGGLLGTCVVLGLARIWDSGIPLNWEVAGFLSLVGTAFALLQAGVLRWLGLSGMAVLAPLYLMAPAVAGMPPELLNPVYRAVLWSWTPFRFTSEGLRSLLFLGSGAPDVQYALWVCAGIGLGGLLLTLGPKPHRRSGQNWKNGNQA